jgi:hypothetical protein
MNNVSSILTFPTIFMITAVSTKSHYRLPDELRNELHRRLKEIFDKSPKSVDTRMRPVLDKKKSEPVPDWF